MNLLLAVFIPVLIKTTPVVQIGAGTDRVDVYQLNDKVCLFEYANEEILTDILYFLDPIDCRDIAFRYRWQL